MHPYCTEQHPFATNTDSQSQLNMSKRKPFEPIQEINPLDFETYNLDGTLWEPGEYPDDKPKFTFTYEDHTVGKTPYPKHTLYVYGKETMLNVMEHFDGYSYTIQ
tara:strand:- start:7027 stop:7341 length:315 start_codon:yes stop_codon:yes gene_type:complete